MQSTDFHQMKEMVTQDKGRMNLFVKGTGICMKARTEAVSDREFVAFRYGKGQKLIVEPWKVSDLKYERIDFSMEIWKFRYGKLKIGLQRYS